MRYTRTLVALSAAALFALCAQDTTAPGHWSEGPRLPTLRSEVSATALDGKVYVVGGYAFGRVNQPIVQAFDPAMQTWSDRAPLPLGMNHIGLVAANGMLYAIGGFVQQNRDPVAAAFAYDPHLDRWQAIAPLPDRRGSIAVAYLDGRIHAVGGHDDARAFTEHDVYDPVTNRWTTAAPLPANEGRDHLGLLAFAGKLYAIGGRFDDSTRNTDLVESYDPSSDRWSERARLPTARSGGAAAVFAGMLFYMGGERGGAGTFAQNEAYDPAHDTWRAFAPLPSGRHGTGAAVIGDALYLPAGGPVDGGSRQSDTLFVFHLP